MAIPIQETDGTVENIGVAFVTAERTSKLLPKGEHLLLCVLSKNRENSIQLHYVDML